MVILVELDYADPADDPAPNGTQHWPVHALPDWVNNTNPDQVRVNGLGDLTGHFRLMDAMGRIVFQQALVQEGTVIPIASLTPGVYAFEIRPEMGNMHRGRLVVGR